MNGDPEKAAGGDSRTRLMTPQRTEAADPTAPASSLARLSLIKMVTTVRS